MNKLLGFGLPAIVIAGFLALWLMTRDPVGALLSLIVLALGLVLLLAVCAYLFANLPEWWRRIRGVTWAEHLTNLEIRGTAVREHYRALRALTFEDLSTSCLVHLVDIGNEQVLCLHGQYYYDFEPIKDDPELNQPRKFPTTDFSLLRHRASWDVLAVFPGPAVLEPVTCEPIRHPKRLQALGIKLSNGEVLKHVSFSALKLALERGA